MSEDPGKHVAFARGYAALGLWADAARELRAAPTEVRARTEVLQIALEVARERGRWPEMARLARRLLKREPDSPAPWLALAYAERRVDCLEAARDTLLRAEDRFPDHPLVQFNLGCYAALLGRADEAERRVLVAVELEPGLRDAACSDEDLAGIRHRLTTALERP